MCGAGAQSTRDAISLAKQAGEAGGDSVICLPPSYYAPSMTREALESYYTEASQPLLLVRLGRSDNLSTVLSPSARRQQSSSRSDLLVAWSEFGIGDRF